ncbi:MAG: ABC transporter ATP-binding protein/permease [Solobacterium sp.]|jgi:ATP-binding cassette subfamily B protein|nr:ABC transporter ATP-binding protein/permease [Solobacterium sp.]MCH4206261.1 ABC transporter ATP-binding protein/permease [Solobacterium sp.]MCH4227692.1 ABC transporter ATP-binding protein/permease [Solobacterium sp.]MCH4283119.1 ABC transporter ATP-binding protein/permease [Solobacterium sp.]
MRNLLKYFKRKDWLLIICSIAFVVAQVALDLKMPDYMSEITRYVQTEGSAMSDVLSAGGKMLLCALGSMASSVIVGYFVAQVAAGFSMRLRDAVYNKVLSFSMEEIGHFSTASLITRSTNDITQVQMVIAFGLQAAVKAPIMAVWAITKIAGRSWQWTAATAAAVAILFVVIVILFILVVPKFTKIQTLTDNLNRVTRENLSGIRVVRAYNAEDYQEEKFEKANSDLTSTNLFTQRAMAVVSPMMSIISGGLTLSIYWIGMYLINAAAGMEKIQLFSDMVVFSSYAMQVIMAFMMLTLTIMILPRAMVSAKRINEVLQTENQIKDGKNDTVCAEKGTIEFDHVSFHYPDAADSILENISFAAKRGETVAFIGSTGSGKTTLINLIPRFYDASAGMVKVDGRDVKEYSQKELRDKIGYAPQKAVLFSGTVASNVAYSENEGKIDEADMEQALEISQSQEFVDEMNGKTEAAIAQGGTNVSGGQKQRLSIARAVYKHPEILIFDDSFSALDYRTDSLLRAALKKEDQDATKIIVAQRIGTIKDADRIIVLDDGKIVGQGTHHELLSSCSTYREIAESQLSKEELFND